MSSSQQRHVVIPFLISLLKNEGKEEPCPGKNGWKELQVDGLSSFDDVAFNDFLNRDEMISYKNRNLNVKMSHPKFPVRNAT